MRCFLQNIQCFIPLVVLIVLENLMKIVYFLSRCVDKSCFRYLLLCNKLPQNSLTLNKSYLLFITSTWVMDSFSVSCGGIWLTHSCIQVGFQLRWECLGWSHSHFGGLCSGYWMGYPGSFPYDLS